MGNTTASKPALQRGNLKECRRPYNLVIVISSTNVVDWWMQEHVAY